MIPESATGLGSGNQQQDGAGQSGVESVSGTSAPATNKRGPGKPQ
jgi:hypothetical protein